MPLDDLGIDEDLLLVLLPGIGREVQDEEPKRKGNLIGGQPDPFAAYISSNIASIVARKAVVDLGHGSGE